MKKVIVLMTALLAVGMLCLTGCDSQTDDPGTPPPDVINPGGDPGSSQSGNSGTAYEGDILENAVSVRIGQGSQKAWQVDMYNNAAAGTMLGYLSGSGLLFPTYTYEEEQGFVAQSVRGSYTRDDEATVADVKAGELYLFSGGQLRLYFKDAEGVNITATPVGRFAETEGLTEAVIEAYESNLGDTWGVDVYFVITKNIDYYVQTR